MAEKPPLISARGPSSPRQELPVTRRQVLVGAVAAGGLAVAWELWPRRYRGALRAGENEWNFGAWLLIGRDGVVTVAVPQLEMGQGITTLLPQIVAHELGADWRQIAMQPVPPSGAQPNVVLAAKWASLWSRVPFTVGGPDSYRARRFAEEMPFAGTADGTSLAAYEAPAREAGATARALLCMAAAERWGVAWEDCEVRGGLVTHGANHATFGDLAEEAAGISPSDEVPLRSDPPQERPLGETESPTLVYPRLDLPSKVDGSALFAGDVRLPGMLYAAIRFGPVGVPNLTGIAEEGTRLPGVRAVLSGRRWLAVAADSWWQAERALEAMRPRFGEGTPFDSAQVPMLLSEAVKDEGAVIAEIGEARDALADGDAVFAASYRVDPALPAPLETASATARFTDGRLDLWIATQMPGLARKAAARAVGIAEGDVALYPVLAGGSFDARIESRQAGQAARMAKALGRPVQLTWSRAEEMRAQPVRTAVAIGVTSKLDPETALPLAWRSRIACPPTMREFGKRHFRDETILAAVEAARGQTDPLACEGAMPPYAIPNARVEHCVVDLNLPTGRMRGNSAAYTAFATESFVDELARRAGRDPLVYRLGMLAGQPRLAAVLQRAARLGEWDGGRAGSSQGLALVRMDAFRDTQKAGGGRIACVAVASMGENGVRVQKLTAVVDIGRIVNLDIARQQIEGGLIFGMGLAMGSAVEFEAGMPQPATLAGLNLPVLSNTPEIVVEFVSSDAPPFDPGELGVAVAPPAIANALFAATGLRFRSLPLRSGAA